jgi:hypothetical protein
MQNTAKITRPQLVIFGTKTITAACVFTNCDVNNYDMIMFHGMTKGFYFRPLLYFQENYILGWLAKSS